MTPSLPDATIVLGHRGASSVERENTIAAFRLALELGAAGVELDVRRTADGLLVVHHDPEIEGHGAIVELEADALPGHVPSLGESLEACRGSLVNVEIKNAPGEPDWDPDHVISAMVAAELADHPDTRVVVSSFSAETAIAAGEADPSLALGLLISPGVELADVVPQAAAAGFWALHPHWTSLDEEAVVDIHDAGLAIITWTVDDPETIRRLAAIGVDAIITNDVAMAVETLAQR